MTCTCRTSRRGPWRPRRRCSRRRRGTPKIASGISQPRGRQLVRGTRSPQSRGRQGAPRWRRRCPPRPPRPPRRTAPARCSTRTRGAPGARMRSRQRACTAARRRRESRNRRRIGRRRRPAWRARTQHHHRGARRASVSEDFMRVCVCASREFSPRDIYANLNARVCARVCVCVCVCARPLVRQICVCV